MGIHGLSKLLGDQAPASMRDNEIKTYFSRKIAVDASMSLYQFLIAVRSEGQVLTDESGETTSHLVGMFYRTIRMLESGIKPVYVFDGKPPTLKSGELAKRYERRKEAVENLKDAQETGDIEAADKFGRRTVKVTREHNEEARRLLQLMGVPYIEAPCEAEAQCAALAKAGKVFAAGSEDMDTLTFGAPILLRHLTFSESRKLPICEVNYSRAITDLGLTSDQFVDLCILLGCDYCDSIPGIGPKKAIALIREHGCIEKIIKNIDTKRHPIPEEWPYLDARELFLNPIVHDPETLEIKWNDPDEEGLVQFMVKEKNFSEDRIRNGVRKILKSKSTSTQSRLDNFFQVLPKKHVLTVSQTAKKPSSLKAKAKVVGKSTKGRPRK